MGEETNKRLLYLVAISRKQEDPLSAIVLSQSGTGKSGITEVIERVTPPEDVALTTGGSCALGKKGIAQRKARRTVS